MNKWITLPLVVMMTFSLCGCGAKEAVQNSVRDALGMEERHSEDNDGSARTLQDSTPAAAGNNTFADTDSGTLASDGDTKSGSSTESGSRQIASVSNPGGYWRKIEDEWLNDPEEGYVWTVTIDDVKTVDMMGLVQVEYDMNLSCSHVGPDMFGAYSGEMAMEYAADMDMLGELLTVTGGSMDYDADGWFRNDNFLMRLEPYSQDVKDEWELAYGKQSMTDDSDEQAIIDAYLGDVFDSMKSDTQEFENENSPKGHWFDWDFRMTEGDMSGFVQLTNIAYGTTAGGGTVDASGKNMAGGAVISVPFAGTFSDRYEDTLESPMPYTLEAYGEGQVVFTLYSANGGPVTVKFYGTIDKIPVEETTLIRERD